MVVERAEHDIELVKTEWLMENHIPMSADTWDQYNRKVSILDIDVGEQDIVLRSDLDVPLTPFAQLPPVEEEFKAYFEQQELEKTQSSSMARAKAKKKKNKKQLEEEAELLAAIEAARKLRAEPWKQRTIQCHKLVDRAALSVRYLQEHLAKRILLLGSIGEKEGRIAMHNSMKIIVDKLQQRVPEIPVQYLDGSIVDNFGETDELKENVCYLLENLNFRPDEHSFVEPWVEPEAPGRVDDAEENKEEEVKAKDSKKMSAAEKKKAEEEQKRKEEEEQRMRDSSAFKLKQQQEAEAAALKEAARQQRLKDEYFDFNTTYNYLTRLGKQFGNIYVNDAPLACLTTSNSVAEIKCDRKVMGLKMTETVRKLA